MSNSPVMKCGHTALGHDSTGHPVCPVCIGINPGATEIDPAPPSIEGRLAVCPYCHKSHNSTWNLPMFEYRPDREVDAFYCGCRGWD